MNSEEINKKLKNINCRGCSNRCSLASPGCNRSKIYIDEAIKNLEEENKKQNDSENNTWENIKLF
ncbi:MAG: hypothetical protein IKE91_04560 [Clostridia bacterium]|nr:hypothetical protein [Clostridia bacterium]